MNLNGLQESFPVTERRAMLLRHRLTTSKLVYRSLLLPKTVDSEFVYTFPRLYKSGRLKPTGKLKRTIPVLRSTSFPIRHSVTI